jgi:hypothetical protein
MANAVENPAAKTEAPLMDKRTKYFLIALGVIGGGALILYQTFLCAACYGGVNGFGF